MLRQHSASTLAPPTYGSRSQKRAFPSTLIAASFPLGNLSTAASASPGFATVLMPTSWSYCRNTHSLLAIVGEASKLRRTFPRFSGTGGSASGFRTLGSRLSRGMIGALAREAVGRLASICSDRLTMIAHVEVTPPILE